MLFNRYIESLLANQIQPPPIQWLHPELNKAVMFCMKQVDGLPSQSTLQGFLDYVR